MNTVAEFKIDVSFNITGRGLVIAGNIISGNINHGDVLTFSFDDQKHHLKIAGVEFGSVRDIISPVPVGLMFAYANEDERTFYKSIKVLPQIALITAVESPSTSP